MSKPLSPQTQAVVTALNTAPAHTGLMAAAVLRAAADQVVPGETKELPPPGDSRTGHYVHGWHDCQINMRRDLLAIAAELEAGG